MAVKLAPSIDPVVPKASQQDIHISVSKLCTNINSNHAQNY